MDTGALRKQNRYQRSDEIEVVVSWVAAPYGLAVETNTTSETSVSNRRTTRRNNPENHDFYFSALKT
jgi:hypothetical protein